MVPLGAAIVAGAVAAHLVPPHWRAAGLPFVSGQGKNVEAAAVVAALVAGIVALRLLSLRWGRLFAWTAALLGGLLFATRLELRLAFAAWPTLVALAALPSALGLFWAEPAQPERHGAPSPGEIPRWLAALALLVLALLAFVLGLEPLEVDVFHHGEVIASALDLLRGGKPFETFIWPHGLHDTGLAAFWISATGKIGTAPVTLGRASCCSLGVLSAYLLGRPLLGSRGAALLAPALLVLTAAAFVQAPPVNSGRHSLHQLGIVVFVALGFALLSSSRRWAALAAGASFGLAYLFRIESGLFGFAAGVALLAVRAVAESRAAPPRSEALPQALVRLGASLLQLCAGVGLVLATCMLLFGWPGAAWFDYTLRELPAYHGDAAGIPLLLPLKTSGPLGEVPLAFCASLAWLSFVTLLSAWGLRLALAASTAGGTGRSVRTAQLAFLAVFAVFTTRSALDRNDAGHVLQWSALPLLAAFLLLIALLRERFGSRALAAVALLPWLLDFGSEAKWPRLSSLRSPHAWAQNLTERARVLREQLAPNPPLGRCADRSFTATEAELGRNRSFLADTCAFEQLLREHHLGALAFEHAAPWYTARFGLPLPTRFFALARAYTPARQLELVEELRKSRPQALLLADGYGAMPRFDIPDAVRVPVVDAYLSERRRNAPVLDTGLGLLFLWDERPACAPRPQAGAATGVAIAAEEIFYQPQTGVLHAKGWVEDAATHTPLRALDPLDPALTAHLELGLARGEQRRASFQLAVRLTAAEWTALRARGSFPLRAVTAPGLEQTLLLDLSAVRLLGELDLAGWSEVRAASERAAALGRADRAAACAASGDLSPCACP